MTRTCPVRAHDRTLPDRHPPAFYTTTAALLAFVKAKQEAELTAAVEANFGPLDLREQ